MATPTELEDLVVRFLERRETESGLAPEEFARAYPERAPELLSALRRTLDVAQLLERGAPETPAAIGPYRILSELGRGGMGVVFAAEREGRPFALKLLPIGLAGSARALERFRRETRALERLAHPNVVRVHDAGVFQGAPYLVMERLEGIELGRLALPLAPERAARIVHALAGAVHAAHMAGVLHRDLKPQNVLLCADERPVLLDFGLMASTDEDTLTETGALLGTPRYMAPEQAAGRPADARTDVHGLGLILYELVYGQAARPEATREAVLRALVRAPPRVPPERRNTVPAALEHVLFATLAHNPRRRPPSAAELAEDLARFLAGEPVRRRPPRAWQRAADALAERPLHVAGGLLAAVGVALVLLLSRPRGPTDEMRAELARGHDEAVGAWLHGAEALARRALERVQALRRDDPLTRVLAAGLEGVPAPTTGLEAEHVELAHALELLASAREPEAARSLAPLAVRSPVAAALRLHALRLPTQRGSDTDARALESGRAAAQRFPDSAAVAAGYARLLLEHGEATDAERVLAAAQARAPDSAPLCAQRARALARQGRLAQALDECVRAADLAEAAGGDPTLELPRLLAQLGAAEGGAPLEVTELLRRRIESGDARAPLWYALAYLHDSRHELARAAEAYERALALEPEHYRARINLAHLHAGAQLGACQQCDAAYARAPAMLAPERALEHLRRALQTDRGRSETGVGRVVQTALDLGQRAPEADPLGHVAGFLRDLLATPDLSAAGRARVEEGLERVRIARGD